MSYISLLAQAGKAAAPYLKPLAINWANPSVRVCLLSLRVSMHSV